MNTGGKASGQRGATLVVTLVMLLMLMLMVGSAYTLSGSNLKAVGNMQFRDEAIAAANIGIQRVIGSGFETNPVSQDFDVDMNNDGTRDYVVQMLAPVCTSAKKTPSTVVCSGPLMPMCKSNWDTYWELNATVTDNLSGASVKVRSGVRVQLTEIQKNTACGV